MIIPYINRELSWVEFNKRVLEEAQNKDNPLLEKMRFLSITESNLDEFNMVRVSKAYNNLQNDKKGKEDASGYNAKTLFNELTKKLHSFSLEQYETYEKLKDELKDENITICSMKELESSDIKFLKDYFVRAIYPVLTPLAIDNNRPFPLLYNHRLNIFVKLISDSKSSKKPLYAIVQVPSLLDRLIKLPKLEEEIEEKDENEENTQTLSATANQYYAQANIFDENENSEKSDDKSKKKAKKQERFVFLEDVITFFLDLLFNKVRVLNSAPFRITRDGDIHLDEDNENMLAEMSKGVKSRRRGKIIRLCVSKNMDESLLKMLVEALQIKEDKLIYKIDGPLDLNFLMAFASKLNIKKLSFEANSTIIPSFINEYDNILDAIKEKDRLIFHPYETFDTVVKFIKDASQDENVLAIKQTLYRVSSDSPIVKALMMAAENQKQVTVLVELKARFDEENNITWAKKLEAAGCHVIYGLKNLKVHSKITLVVRQEEDGIRRYCHLGTGNYNDKSAKVYTDYSLFTANKAIGEDASTFFNELTGYSEGSNYLRLIVAPNYLRQFLYDSIDNEIENAKNGDEAEIYIKVNAIVDERMVRKLYEASNAGVKIKALVRGMCSLQPNVNDFSKNIEVHSIVGRYLEHARVFVFHNGGNKKVYLASADMMSRNLDRRVEIAFPIENESIKTRIINEFELMWNDNVNTRILHINGKYSKIENDKNTEKINSHKLLFEKCKND